MVGGAVFAGLTCCAAVPLSVNPATAASTSRTLPPIIAIHRLLLRLTVNPPYRLRAVLATRETGKNAEADEIHTTLTSPSRLRSARSGMGPVPQPVFKTGEVV